MELTTRRQQHMLQSAVMMAAAVADSWDTSKCSNDHDSFNFWLTESSNDWFLNTWQSWLLFWYFPNSMTIKGAFIQGKMEEHFKMFQRYRPQLVVFLIWSNPDFFFIFVLFTIQWEIQSQFNHITQKAEHRCCARLGFEPWATGWQAQTDSLEKAHQTQNILA